MSLRIYDYNKGFFLSLKCNEAFLGEELKGAVRIKVDSRSEADIDIENIWIKVQCKENVEKESAILYKTRLPVMNSLIVHAGFDKEFPFTVKLPSVGRETFHSVHQNVWWLVNGFMKVKGIKQIIEAQGGCEVFIKKPIGQSTQVVKEIVREIVLIPCPYCGGLMSQTSIFCPNCGARRKKP